jgi:hypothetical protein
MKRVVLSILISAFVSSFGWSQIYLDSTVNSSTKRVQFANLKQFSIGSYGEGHYNQKIDQGTFQNGKVDLHRVIMFMGYKFNKDLQFFSEIEFEHVKEVYVEQAFMNYSFNSLLNFKAGIILIPMGYVNEFHEPTLFNGVERPNVDKYVIPSTWREMGLGFHGLVKKANLKYQLYMVNGFEGYDGSAKLSGKNGLRSARQKGAEASFRTPALTGKLSFYGFNGLRLGVSGYYGTTESSLYNGLDKSDNVAIQQADSSRVGVSMLAFNVNYKLGNLIFRGEGNMTALSNTNQYNTFTGSNVGSQIRGAYGEVSYNQKLSKTKSFPLLIPFVRYENYDTHYKIAGDISENDAYHREELTVGAGLQLTPGAIFKADFQWVKTTANPRPFNVLNVGFGYWF